MIDQLTVFADRFPRQYRSILANQTTGQPIPVSLLADIPTMVRNFQDWYQTRSATDEVDAVGFYPRRNKLARDLQDKYNVPTLTQVSDVLAICSPRTPPALEYANATVIVRHWSTGSPLLTDAGRNLFATGRQITSALLRLAGSDHKLGNKLFDYSHSIQFPDYPASPVVDTWIHIAGADGLSDEPVAYDSFAVSPARYPYIQYALMLASNADEVPCREYQSLVWHIVRRLRARHYAVRAEYASREPRLE